jgi:hypothetical protein
LKFPPSSLLIIGLAISAVINLILLLAVLLR